MPLTVTPVAGDGALSPAWRANVLLPDSGQTIAVNGTYQPPLVGSSPQGLRPVLSFAGTVAAPAVPGSGTTYWICTVNLSTGALATATSPTAVPLPSAGTAVVFQQTLPSTAPAAISQQGGFAFPWL